MSDISLKTKEIPSFLCKQNLLPIAHPEYLFPESRNPYWKKLEENAGEVFKDNPAEALAGKWKSVFPKTEFSEKAPLHVEIGCNGGHVLLELAKKNPQNLYVGVDWKYKQIHFAFEKAQKREISNIRFLRTHAERLNYHFGPEEIDHLAIYFPDPWPQKPRYKNRLIGAAWLEKIAPLLKKSGTLHIKTDHEGYFDWMLEAVAQVPEKWKTLEVTRDLHKSHPNPKSLDLPEVTLFEKIFIKDGIPIKSLHLQRL
jgi:tRNA (guanine-N7-)-methyltransferase